MRHGRMVLAALLAVQSAWAAGPALLATMGSRASFAFDGKPVTILVGESSHGIRLVSVTTDSAVVESAGKRSTVRLGQDFFAAGPTASDSAASGSANRISLNGVSGHFMVTVHTANGSLPGLIDTGATYFALSARSANQLGITAGSDGTLVNLSTASGIETAVKTTVPEIRLEGITLYNVETVIHRGNAPAVPLIGMSILQRFSMQRDGDNMTLTKRY